MNTIHMLLTLTFITLSFFSEETGAVQLLRGEQNRKSVIVKPIINSSPKMLSSRLTEGELLLSIFHEGIAGALAGGLQVIFLMWLRTTTSYQHKYGLSLRDAMRDLYRQGGCKRFYKGIGFAFLQAPLSKFCSVASNDCTLVLTKQFDQGSLLSVMIFTALGGILSSCFRALLMPIDTCKTVLQVDGEIGFRRLKNKVMSGDITPLYQGTLATIATTFAGHYPWFMVHNVLQGKLNIPSSSRWKLLESAFIALVATTVSDTLTNSIRVVKTVKQTSGGNKQLSYFEAVTHILNGSGYRGLLARGLNTRLLSNCLQSIAFTVIWKQISRK